MLDKYTLGLNFLHSDSSACLFKNNQLIAASEEERFTRVKHTSNFPINSINFCLKEANINISKIDLVTVNTNPFSGILKKIYYVLSNFSALRIVISSLLNSKKKINLSKMILEIDKKNNFKGKIKYVDHHESHIASSLFFSNFNECANLSIDGFGDFASCAYGLYQKNHLNIDHKINFPHSLGIYYQALTQFLGFKSYGDEYKLMGLSSYGEPKYINEISKIIFKTSKGFRLNLKYFIHHKKKIFHLNSNGQFIYENLYSNSLKTLLGKERDINENISQKHLDLAKSTQVVYEDILQHLVNIVYKKYESENLTISGGCAMNSLANGKIIKNSKFKNIYISPNPGDAGGSIGSASLVLSKELNKKITTSNYSYLGPNYNNQEISNLIIKKKLEEKFKVKYFEDSDLYSFVANEISKEKIIGWFQGKAEWGPRALGNRSILADPRNYKIKDIINLKIKRRENFRPFAPSILRDHVKDWFEEDADVPYMSEVRMVKENKRELIPGVVHVDGSGRLQTVTKNQNHHYYNLIQEFYNQTGVPIILNTSFNENEPIVNNPIEAIECYERTNMDILVIGNWIIQR
tara:strand:- start:1694 stop:3427 length:1734 start_codon:yes stop_codon:yes gene_type:complete